MGSVTPRSWLYLPVNEPHIAVEKAGGLENAVAPAKYLEHGQSRRPQVPKRHGNWLVSDLYAEKPNLYLPCCFGSPPFSQRF